MKSPSSTEPCRVRILSRLIFNALRYKYLKRRGRPSLLQSISIEVTNRCICRCLMCNIWKLQQTEPELSVEALKGLFSSPELRDLRELDITGGEPFLREDLEELFDMIADLKESHLPALRTLAVTTNGILTEKVLGVTSATLEKLNNKGVELVLACGLDAIGELHDTIRNHKGAWQALDKTISGLVELRKKHPNLILGIKSTIVPQNVSELNRISEYAKRNNLFTIVSPCIITGNRFANIELNQSLQFSDADKKLMVDFYAQPEFRWDGHRLTMLNFLKTGLSEKPCSAGFNTLFIRCNGDVFPCPITSTSHYLGNIAKSTLGSCMSSSTAVEFRKKIRRHPECLTCTEPGLERLGWVFEGAVFIRHILRMKNKELNTFIHHMGFDKYL